MAANWRENLDIRTPKQTANGSKISTFKKITLLKNKGVSFFFSFQDEEHIFWHNRYS